ncbi:helix-turn-helix transcriptional regulator [Acutalibacter muris]|uniref:helix-turn-helix transcriptional regulator n=1 Tax=Acutalibacter muris TaxID=1796620 RepID=UPI000AD06748
MHAWEAIEQSLDFIEEHLAEEILTEELANIACLSPFYFQRLFKRLVSKPVQEYVKLRRLAKVIENLKDTDRRILDIAMDYGFSSHANFTRVFKETYGITPDEYRKDLPMLNTFDRPQVLMNYVLVDEGVPLVVGDIVLGIQRKTLEQPDTYLGFETEVNISEQTPVGESTGVDVPGQLWRRYYKEKELLGASLRTCLASI